MLFTKIFDHILVFIDTGMGSTNQTAFQKTCRKRGCCPDRSTFPNVCSTTVSTYTASCKFSNVKMKSKATDQYGIGARNRILAVPIEGILKGCRMDQPCLPDTKWAGGTILLLEN